MVPWLPPPMTPAERHELRHQGPVFHVPRESPPSCVNHAFERALAALDRGA